MVTEPAYRSDSRPDFAPLEESCGSIRGFAFAGDLRSELAASRLAGPAALDLLDDMLAIRELEEMIVRLRSGGYDALPGYDYRGPTHVSIGQEGTAVGACAGLRADDHVTSSHRGHGDAIAKGFAAIRTMPDDALRARVPWSVASDRDGLLDDALEEHVYRTIAELFGKEEGYCRGRGGGMHIGDFSTGHLGANAIVGGSVPIATGAAMAVRYQRSDKVVCCFAGDGAYANGVVLESLNWASQVQWTNFLAGDRAYGLPIIYCIQNNHYGMTHRTDDEVMGVRHLARRAAGFAENNMHAEVVNGMDVLAVRDAVDRAAAICRDGHGPVLIEASTYRYYGHSLSDPRNEYRTRDEENGLAGRRPDRAAEAPDRRGRCGRRGNRRRGRGGVPASATPAPPCAPPRPRIRTVPTSSSTSTRTPRRTWFRPRTRSCTRTRIRPSPSASTGRSPTRTPSARRSSRRCCATRA